MALGSVRNWIAVQQSNLNKKMKTKNMTTLRLRNSINLPSARRLFLLAGLLAGMLAIMGTSPASAADLVAIDVFPNNPVVQLGFAVQFTAVGTFSDGSTQDLTATATWSSSANSVATIS